MLYYYVHTTKILSVSFSFKVWMAREYQTKSSIIHKKVEDILTVQEKMES